MYKNHMAFDDPYLFDAIQYAPSWTVRAVYETGEDILSGLTYDQAREWARDIREGESGEFISGLIRIDVIPDHN
jgi:hypothetical protein